MSENAIDYFGWDDCEINEEWAGMDLRKAIDAARTLNREEERDAG